jgi:hypothetical protein
MRALRIRRLIGLQPDWLIRREAHVETARLRSIPFLCEKPAKNKKSFAAKVHKWRQYGRRPTFERDRTPYPYLADSNNPPADR